ncbi:MAG: hypothetical protein ABIQ33_13295 [Caldimonas sp.]
MKTLLSLSRTLPIAAAIGLSASLVCEPAAAGRTGGGGRVVAAGGWHGGAGHHRGGHWVHHGHRGPYWPGAYWGGIGLGLGIGAVGYYGGYYGNYWGPYYRAYHDDPPLVVTPVYGSVEPGAPRTGQPVPHAAAPDPIFYPKNGQGAEATESDRRECNRWATTQAGAMADASIFQRATLACMEGRGYTVR